MIDRRVVGASGLHVSALALGTMTFARSGPYADIASSDADMARIVDMALDVGIDTFDTANVYGAGESEEILGRLLGARRSQAVISTKLRFPTDAAAGARPPYGAYGLSRHALIGGVEAALRRLRTDYIDLLHFHMQDRTTPIQETLRAVDDLIAQGKVRYCGVSNFTGYRLVEALWRADALGLQAPVSLQVPWSLLNRAAERELVPAARQHRLGIFVYSPLARGLLSSKYRRGEPPPAGSRLAAWREEWTEHDVPRTWDIVEAVERVATAHEVGAAAVALAWCLSRPATASVIVGARTPAQFQECLQAIGLRLPRPQLERLDAVSEPDWGYPYSFIRRFEPW